MRFRSSWIAFFSAARASEILCHSFALSCCTPSNRPIQYQILILPKLASMAKAGHAKERGASKSEGKAHKYEKKRAQREGD